jgi:hypothetical protein
MIALPIREFGNLSVSEAPGGDFPPAVLAALTHGRLVEAINLVEEEQGLEYDDAKIVIECYLSRQIP